MPHPRLTPESKDADPDPLVSLLFEQVTAERLLAEARHQEILARFQEQVTKLQSNLSEENQHFREIETVLTKSMSSLPSVGEGEHCELRHQVTDRAHRLTQQLHNEAPSQGESEQHLSKASTFAFGSKWYSEDSELIGVAFWHPKLISSHIRSMVSRHSFELFISGMITLNALVMCFEVQYAGIRTGRKLKYDPDGEHSDDVWPGAETAFLVFDWFFGILFLMEALLKLMGFRLQYFCVGWNLIDFTSVFAFVMDKITAALDVQFLDAQTVRLIRLFRLVRLVRLIRTLERLDILYIMTTAIKGMHMVVVWSVALLSLMLMTCALFLSEFLQSTYFNDAAFENLSSTDLASRLQLYKYFGSFTRCMFSMFELTLANWPPVARLLTEEISEWFSVICVLHKLTFGLAVMGVINGVILQETFKVALTDDMVMVRQRKRAKIAMTQKMEALFEALDLDNDGKLTFPEFMIVASQPDVMLWLESLEIETDDLLTLFLLLDTDMDGTLTVDELISQVPRLRGHARGIDMLALRKDIPHFQIQHEEDETYRFEMTKGMAADKLGEITEATYLRGDGPSNMHSGLY